MRQVVAIAGLPGAGKTTLVKWMTSRYQLHVVDRDQLRHARYRPCSYTREESRAVERDMLVQVGNIAAEGRDVVVDGMTFSSRQVRTAFASSAAAAGARFHLLWLDVPVAVARNRVASDPGHPAADRVPALVAAVADRFEVVENCALRLDGNLAPAELQQRASAFLDRYLRRIHS